MEPRTNISSTLSVLRQPLLTISALVREALIGFSSMKLYDSVWQFQLNVERNIQFHEPHPHGKLPFTTALNFGRRLNRTYGWFGVFALGEF
jgi:hypothetical protein